MLSVDYASAKSLRRMANPIPRMLALLNELKIFARMLNVINHSLGPSTNTSELEAIRNNKTNNTGSFMLVITARSKGSVDKSLRIASFQVPGDNFLEDEEAESLTIKTLHMFYVAHPDRLKLTGGSETNKLGLAKGTYICFNCFIDEGKAIVQYKARLLCMQADTVEIEEDENVGMNSLVSRKCSSSRGSTAVPEKRPRLLTNNFSALGRPTQAAVEAETIDVVFTKLECIMTDKDAELLKDDNKKQFKINGDNQQYVAKRFYDIGQGQEVGVPEDVNQLSLAKDLV
ncbi:hypothetical protein B0H10DRAFT_1955513 [Mycena sp. CBHHK59/15]|nr:hypothetical protein B0H10DRAFT_1955513 [Mycena sp. CBHHK59/15]